MSLTILVISTLLIVIITESQDVFATNGDGPKQKHIDKHEEKHGDKHKDKHDDKKKEKHKDKHDDKKKKKLFKKIKEKIIPFIKEKLEKHKGKIIEKIKQKIADYKEKSSKKTTHIVDDDKDESNPVTSTNDDEVKTPDATNNDDEQTSVQGEATSQIVEMNKFKGSGNDHAPTLGNDRYGNNYVENGFTFNDFVTDVENFKTHMPLQTLQVGELNTAVLKIYDNRGANKIEHVEIAFGLDSKEFASQSENTIIWTQNFKGDQSIIENDSDNLLMDVSAAGESNGKILEITFNFAFREPMDKSKIGVVVWDHDRRSRTIYFNEGIEVVDESLNPQEIISILDEKGNPVRITMTGKSEGIDEDGNIWTHNSPWIKQKMSVDKTLAHENPEPVGNHGFDRSHNMFDSYKNSQAQTAQEKLIEILGGRNINNFSD